MGPNNDPGNNLNVAKLKTMISDGNISQQESGKINKIDKEGLSHITKTSLKKVANSLLQKGFSTKDKKIYISYKKMIDNYTDKKIPSWKDLEKAVKMNLGILSNALVYNGNFNDEDFHGIQITGDEIKIRYDAIGTDDTLNLKYDAGLGIIITSSLKNNWTKEKDEETDFKNTAKVDKDLLKGVKDVNKNNSNTSWQMDSDISGTKEYEIKKQTYLNLFDKNRMKNNDNTFIVKDLINMDPTLLRDIYNENRYLMSMVFNNLEKGLLEVVYSRVPEFLAIKTLEQAKEIRHPEDEDLFEDFFGKPSEEDIAIRENNFELKMNEFSKLITDMYQNGNFNSIYQSLKGISEPLKMLPEDVREGIIFNTINEGKELDNLNFFNENNGQLLSSRLEIINNEQLLSNLINLLKVGNQELTDNIINRVESINSFNSLNDEMKSNIIHSIDSNLNENNNLTISKLEKDIINDLRYNLVNSSNHLIEKYTLDIPKNKQKKSKSKNV